jgi:hypothetical protein
MADGIRIYHPTARSSVLHVPHPGDRSSGRRPKVYKIELDPNGEAIISATIWQRLEEARGFGWPHDLIIANIVGHPPRQRIAVGRARRRQTLPIVNVERT